MDTAAVMTCLDLVIMSDTAVAHLTELLGVPGWITLSAMPDRRRLPSATTIRATPAMRIFRAGPSWSGDRASIASASCCVMGHRGCEKRPTLGRN